MDFRTLLSRCSAPSLAILSPLGKKVMAGEINGIILVVGLEGEYTRQKYILTAFPGHPQVLLSLQLPGSNSNHYSLAMLVQAAFSYSVNIESETGPPIGGGMLLIRLDERNVSAIDYSKKYRRECNARAEPAVQRLADEIGFGRLDEFVRDGL